MQRDCFAPARNDILRPTVTEGLKQLPKMVTFSRRVTPAKAGVQNLVKRLDFGFRRNDKAANPEAGLSGKLLAIAISQSTLWVWFSLERSTRVKYFILRWCCPLEMNNIDSDCREVK
jgi:hypothetical protein